MNRRRSARLAVVVIGSSLLLLPAAAHAFWSTTATQPVQATARTMTHVGDVRCTNVDGGVRLSWTPEEPEPAPSYVIRGEGGDFVDRTQQSSYDIQPGASVIDLLFGMLDPSEAEATTLNVHASGLPSDAGGRSGWESAGSSVAIHTERQDLLGLTVVVRCG